MRTKEKYEGFQKDMDNWRQTQTSLEHGTVVQPSPTDMTSIWINVAGGPKKGRVYGLGVLRSSCSPSPLFPTNGSTSQNTEEMEAMKNQIIELTEKCVTNNARFAKFEKLFKKHMPQLSDDEEETKSDEDLIVIVGYYFL